jgi:hypothetical protein
MKRYVLIVAGGSLFAWGMSTAISGCGGEEEAAIPDADGGGAGSSSGGGSSGAASSSGGSSSGGTSSSGGAGDGGGGDGGGDATTGGPSNPGKTTCGTKECTSATETCCQSQNDAGCIANNMNCGFGTASKECDEAADCQGGDICCQQGVSTECRPAKDCDGFGEFITCKTNTECAGQDGGTCKEWTCTFFKTETKVRACENPSPQNCK